MRKLVNLLRDSRLSAMTVNDTVLKFNEYHDLMTRDYYLYVVRLISEAARKCRLDAEIIIGDYYARSFGLRRKFKIDFQIEHTLVKEGGRGSERAPLGSVAVLGNPEERYLVRIQAFERLTRADAIIEYSKPNLVNVRSSGLFPEFAKKVHYVAPLIYPIEPQVFTTNRDLPVITLFGNPNEPRRKALLESLISWNPVCQNIGNRFEDVKALYERTRILVNVRQTDYHDTLEELRVLPALMSGAIVVSEDVPLRSEIPYKDFIYWAPLREIVQLVEEVHGNYERYFHETFCDGRLVQCLKQMSAENERVAQELLCSLPAARARLHSSIS